MAAILLLLAAGALLPSAPAADVKGVDFIRDIRPILSDNCFACHGPDESKRVAGLRLDTQEGAFAKRGSSAPIVPGNSSQSRVYQRVTHADARLKMPPPPSGRSLTPQQVDLLKRWIDSGAEYRVHWAYQAPRRVDPPAAKKAKWVRNAIDNFVLARLDKEGLEPAPEADRVTLLRRLSFDLTGLPPTLAELDAFLRDRSPNAYEKQVDRLLASEHYGERMAMQWLDLARYADTHGFHIDSHRDMWPWRDWVIRAFNANMPFDRFTVEQIAGDLLPNPTRDQVIASGFNRNHMINYEGGAIPDEYLVEYVADRTETTSTVWLAMTMTCARCHDHKYDPIKQKDYYRLFAFFNTVKEKGLDGKDGNAEPFLMLPEPDQKTRLEELTRRIDARNIELAEEKVKPAMAEWEKAFQAGAPASLREGLLAHYEMDGGLSDSSGHYRHGRVRAGQVNPVQAPMGRALEFNPPAAVDLGGVSLGANFTLAGWLRQGYHEPQTIFEQPGKLDVWYDASDPLPHLRRGAHLHVEAPGTHLRTRDRLVQGDHYHVTILHREGSLSLRINGVPVPVVNETPAMAVGAAAPGALRVGTASPRDGRDAFRGRLADLRIYDRVLGDDEVRHLGVHGPAPELVAIDAAKRTREQSEFLRDYFLQHHAPKPLRDAYADSRELRASKALLSDEIPNTMVMTEADKPRDTFVLERGDYRNRRDKVTPDTPGALPPLGAQGSVDRLALARWLVNPGNPLTARVAVNRYWQNYFGLGLVKTSENFGSQGEPPSHPELLDWLATEFVRTNWDVRAMQKLIVMSATYRQSSATTAAMAQRDPENRLLSHMSRFRLPAEVVRDNALAVSGLLNSKVGGRSVYPYQPPGIWEEISRGEIFSAQVYRQSHGDDLYRRSMYWFWKRTAPPASLLTFDAPDREKCVARRSVTNTPLQALVLWNDPTYIEASRVLAQRVFEQSGADPMKRVQLAFRTATGRLPQPREAKLLVELAAKQKARYDGDPEAARQLLAIGEAKADPKWNPAELAAWTNVASAILSLDETITKE